MPCAPATQNLTKIKKDSSTVSHQRVRAVHPGSAASVPILGSGREPEERRGIGSRSSPASWALVHRGAQQPLSESLQEG